MSTDETDDTDRCGVLASVLGQAEGFATDDNGRFIFPKEYEAEGAVLKSLRSHVSALPSACLAHADYIFMAHANLAKNAKTMSYEYVSHRSHNACAWLVQEISQMASRFALAASGMYTFGETPTAVSDSDAAHSVKVCEVCVRQKSARDKNQFNP